MGFAQQRRQKRPVGFVRISKSIPSFRGCLETRHEDRHQLVGLLYENATRMTRVANAIKRASKSQALPFMIRTSSFVNLRFLNNLFLMAAPHGLGTKARADPGWYVDGLRFSCRLSGTASPVHNHCRAGLVLDLNREALLHQLLPGNACRSGNVALRDLIHGYRV